MLWVVEASDPERILATISHGLEEAEFHRKWAGLAADDPVEPLLEPWGPQSDRADGLLDLFRQVLLTDAAYVARLKRHYALFKQSLPGWEARPSMA